MRERHWKEVMSITGHDLNLAEDVFKLQHLLDCNILKYREEIEDLTGAAVKEEQIENKLAAIQVRAAARVEGVAMGPCTQRPSASEEAGCRCERTWWRRWTGRASTWCSPSTRRAGR